LLQKVQQHEIFSSRNNTQAAFDNFFAPRKRKVDQMNNKEAESTTKTSPAKTPAMDNPPPPSWDALFQFVCMKTNDSDFCKKHESKDAPLGLIAVASYVNDYLAKSNDCSMVDFFFRDITLTVPHSPQIHSNPHYHSIVGQ
jgi:hypothetical protein